MAKELRVIDVTTPSVLHEPLVRALNGSGPAVFPVDGSREIAPPARIPNDAVLVVQTSGSTSHPKRVWHTRASLLAAARQVQEELGEPGVWWMALPAHYIAGVMVYVRAFASGGGVISKGPDENIVSALLDFQKRNLAEGSSAPRYTSMVPRQLADLITAAEDDQEVLAALRGFSRILVGGQRVPELLFVRAEELGISVTRTYGSAETAGGCVWDGMPLSDTEADVIDGRLAIAGPLLAGGYVDDSKRTNDSFITRGTKRWYLTDDLGTIGGGVIRVTGRVDRVIISGGIKVNLDEVEAFIQSKYPGSSLVTAAVADDDWGESIAVVADVEFSENNLPEVVANQFGPAARISRLKTVPDLPRLSSGKPDRQAISRLLG